MPSTPTTTPLINTSTRPPPDVSIDTNVLYCICKRPYDVPRFMIACDKCDQWFHGECIQISEKQGEFIDLYFCENCAKSKYEKKKRKKKGVVLILKNKNSYREKDFMETSMC